MDDFDKEFDKAVENDEEVEQEIEDTQEDEAEDTVESPTDEAAEQPPQEDWEHRYKSNAGRITAYQNQIEQLQRELKEVKQRQQTAKPDTNELPEWEELKETDPELVTAIERKIQAQTQALQSQLGQLSQREKMRMEQERQQYYQSQYAALDANVEGWREIAASQEWKEWLDNAPPGVRRMSTTEDAKELEVLFNLFKGQTSHTNVSNIKEKRKKNMENSASQITSRGVTPAPGEPDDYESAFNYFVKKDLKRAG